MEGDPFSTPVVHLPRMLQDLLVVGNVAVGVALVVLGLRDYGTAAQHQSEQPHAQPLPLPRARNRPEARHKTGAPCVLHGVPPPPISLNDTTSPVSSRYRVSYTLQVWSSALLALVS